MSNSCAVLIVSFFLRVQDEWVTCQRNWLYLESIFNAPDIQRQLPAEAKMFLQVDKSWKDIMRKVNTFPNALRAATQPGQTHQRYTVITSAINIETRHSICVYIYLSLSIYLYL